MWTGMAAGRQIPHRRINVFLWAGVFAVRPNGKLLEIKNAIPSYLSSNSMVKCFAALPAFYLHEQIKTDAKLH